MRKFDSLSEREMLALPISLEEADPWRAALRTRNQFLAQTTL
jgi:hypothetical protein